MQPTDVYTIRFPFWKGIRVIPHKRWIIDSGGSIAGWGMGWGGRSPPLEWCLKSFFGNQFFSLLLFQTGSHKFFPNYKFITQDCFSTLRRVKTWLRSRMSEGRLTGLALAHSLGYSCKCTGCHWKICEKEKKRFLDFVIWNTSQLLYHSCNY